MPTALEFDGPRLMRPEDVAGSDRLARLCFGGSDEDAASAVASTAAEDEPAAPPDPEEQTYLIACQGQPVSQISIFHTALMLGSAAIQVGSIGGVCTHPDFREHRLATRLMEHCTSKLVEGGAGLMLISGQRGLYTRLGNVLGGQYAGFAIRAGQLPPPPPGLRLRKAAPEDARLCSRLYQAEPVHFRRKIARFQKAFRPHEIGFRAEEWIVEMDGQPAAYLLLSILWEYMEQSVTGKRCVAEYAGSRVALAGAISAILAQTSIQEIEAPIPWQDFDFIQLLKGNRPVPGWTILPEHSMRLINFPALMAGLRPYVQARLEPALRRGLRFEQSGPLLSNPAEGRCAITRGSQRLELDTASMTRLVIGSAEESPVTGRAINGALAEIVQALFPLPAFLPGLDYH